MAVNVKAETIYITRDGCGARAPGDSDSRAEAIFDAIEHGWDSLTKWSGTEYTHQDLCPKCFEAWEAKQDEDWGSWMEADAEQF